MAVRLDPRLTAAGHRVTVALLVELWADHMPAHTPAPSTCPGCFHTYTHAHPLCPTAAVVRPLLRRRRRENPAALVALTFNQTADLTDKHLSTTAHLRPTAPAPVCGPEGLFDIGTQASPVAP